MKDRISLAVFWAATGLVLGSLATLQIPRIAVVIAGGIIVVVCLAEHFGLLKRRSGKRALPRSSASGRSSTKKMKKVKAS